MLSRLTCGLWPARPKPELVISQPITEPEPRHSFRISRRVPLKAGVPRLMTPEPEAQRRGRLDVPGHLRPPAQAPTDYEAWITEQLDDAFKAEGKDAKRLSAKAQGKQPERRPILYKAHSSEGRVHFEANGSVKASKASDSSSSKYSSRYA